jgi:hypothetical protein
MNPAARNNRRNTRWLAPLAVLVLVGPVFADDEPAEQVPAALVQQPAAPLDGAEAEAFLRTAAIVARVPIGTGITHPEKLTLSDGTRTARAAWKTLHLHTMGRTKMSDGRVELDFRDSWKHDVAAYELDKLLGLGLVPPTVERRIDGRSGALQLWIEGAMTELQRRSEGVQPPDRQSWVERGSAVRLLRELAYDTDYNIQNTLYGPGFRVYAIDFSRAFRVAPQLLSAARLGRLSPEAVDALRRLDRATLEVRLGPWLDRHQISGLLARRDAIVALADSRLAAAARH